MKLFRLKSYDHVPPNCFQWPRHGKSPVIEELAKKESAFRQANGFPRAGFRQCLEDVDAYNATVVLDGDPRFTTPAEGPGIALGEMSAFLAECHACGAPV